ncbi:MAG TPA: ferrochelatase [Thermomicrobiales bacterium]|nr:ferrochelatase [Thermomicrobiales bacterium]
MTESSPASGMHTDPGPGQPNNHLMLMAYGGPDTLDDVRPYLMDVRNYRPTSDHIVDEITERYRQIGGRSPILELTNAEAAGIERELNANAGEGERWKVWVAMRHWHPFIKDVMAEMERAGVTQAIGLVMAPHYSRMSIGAYYKRVEAAGSPIKVTELRSWNLLPGYLDALTDRIQTALRKFPEDVRAAVPVIFTAHSLPERIREWNDPYERELQETVAALRERFPDQPSEWAYQSAAMTPDPWLGPDASEVISRLHAEGVRNVLICPVGFVCEHVEILFDIDVEFTQHANALGMRLERIEMLNDHPALLAGLAGLVRTHAQDAGVLHIQPAEVSATT